MQLTFAMELAIGKKLKCVPTLPDLPYKISTYTDLKRFNWRTEENTQFVACYTSNFWCRIIPACFFLKLNASWLLKHRIYINKAQHYEEWLTWIGLVNYLKPIAVFTNHVTCCKWTKYNIVFMLASTSFGQLLPNARWICAKILCGALLFQHHY